MRPELRTNWMIAVALTGWLIYLLAPILTPFVAGRCWPTSAIRSPIVCSACKCPARGGGAVFLLTFCIVGLLVLLCCR